MEAYEFYTTPENGTIKIPEHIRSRITSGVKVILLEKKAGKSDKEEGSVQKRTELLSAISIDTRDWKFDREEANER